MLDDVLVGSEKPRNRKSARSMLVGVVLYVVVLLVTCVFIKVSPVVDNKQSFCLLEIVRY